MNHTYDKKFEHDVRASMQVIPQLLQNLLTWTTGKPLHAEERRLVLPDWLDVLVTLAIVAASIVGLTQLAQLESWLSWLGIPPLWLILVGTLRKIQVTHLHHAIHNCLFKNSILNKTFARIVPSLIIVQNGTEYRKDHLGHHNYYNYTTRADADAAFLAKLGFLPGRSKEELWTNLWMTIFSPVFHLMFAKARVLSVFRNGTASTVFGIAVLGCIISAVLQLGIQTVAIAVLIPFFPLYHISSLLQFLTEHGWNVDEGSVNDWEEYKARCWGRFCGEAFPQKTASGFSEAGRHAVAVFKWISRMLLIHLPTRIGCLVSDLPAHDWHHLAHMCGQNVKDWTNSIYLREQAIANGDKPDFSSRELWGLWNMVEHQFNWLENLSRHPTGSVIAPAKRIESLSTAGN